MNNLFNWSDQFWLRLDQIGILVGDVMMLLTILTAIYGFIKRDTLRRWFRHNRFPSVGGEIGHQQYDALLCTISHSELPIWLIDQLQPGAIALIATSQSQQAAGQVAEYAAARGIEIVNTQPLNSADDVAEVRTKACQLLGQLTEAYGPNCAVDITGGKVPMSLGAFMAAEEYGVDTLYVSAQFDRQLKRVDSATARLLRLSNPPE